MEENNQEHKFNWRVVIALAIFCILIFVVIAFAVNQQREADQQVQAEKQAEYLKAISTPLSTSNERSNPVHFNVGDTVSGSEIRLSTGQKLSYKAIRNSPYSGTLGYGNIWRSDVPDDVLLNKEKSGNRYKLALDADLQKVETDDDLPLSFDAGKTVSGDLIVLSSGEVYEKSAIRNCPFSGKVYDGAIWLAGITDEDISKQKVKLVMPSVDKPDGYYDGRSPYDTEKAANHTVSFKKGDTVYGYAVSVAGKTFYMAAIVNSPYSGTVTNGRVVPKYSEYGYNESVDGHNSGFKLVNPDTDQPWSRRHLRVNINYDGWFDDIPFEVGDTVVGCLDFSNGQHFDYAAVQNSPYSGRVSFDRHHVNNAAVLWPTASEFNEILSCSGSGSYGTASQVLLLGPGDFN